MDPFEFARVSSFLTRLAWYSTRPISDPEVREFEERTTAGTMVDIYQHRRKSLATWIAVHGVTVNGRKDSRLMNFARSLAHFGVTCLVPSLPGLTSCRWETGDLDELGQVVTIALEKYQQSVGLIGFSYGGSYSLLVASRKELSAHVHCVVTFGAYHNLKDVFESHIKSLDSEPQSDDEWDETIYQRLVFLYAHDDPTLIPPAVKSEMLTLLKRYCDVANMAEKLQFYQRHLHHLKLAPLTKHLLSLEVLPQLSPAGNIRTLTCPVALIHDRYDRAIAPIHAERLFAELQTTPLAKRHKLVVTSLLSHVSPAHVLKIGELIRILHALAPILHAPDR
ncbi:alpha/beta hydrolase family protein [candidate division CSSED10-310 bacterium]|uniref:Alpha/beta hydrolase family protein n=1 Tax=candidate division CSSED10-310 bacterium TaxID=2855610 RepID=A0ABV6Z4J7_UNCC1